MTNTATRTIRRVLLSSIAGAAAAVVAMWWVGATAQAASATVTPLMSKDLVYAAGKEISMFTVEYHPGAVDPIHTHNAQAMVYVVEGSIVMQVKGGPAVTLKAGETFYEGPDDVHVVGRNASTTAPAKFVVVLIKDKGAPLLVPVQ